jgi:hypothetical protein
MADLQDIQRELERQTTRLVLIDGRHEWANLYRLIQTVLLALIVWRVW